MAVQQGKVDVVRVLTEAKANINIQTKVHSYTVGTHKYAEGLLHSK